MAEIATPEYAAERTDPDQGWREALMCMCEWLEAGEPFCHLRFADGEFHALTGTASGDLVNTDGHHYFPQMGTELAEVLHRVAAKYPQHGNVLIGGDWGAEPEHRRYLVEHDLLRRIPWVPSQVFVAGVVDLSALRFLHGLREYRHSIVLVGNRFIGDAARTLGHHAASYVEIPAHDAWVESERIIGDIWAELQPGALVIYCAGMPCKAWGWRLWEDTDHTTTHVDMGHFFDLAYGIRSRVWHTENSENRIHGSRVKAYMEHFAPLIRGDA